MDGAPPPEEDFSKIALPERSVHKNWKARLSAYTDLNAKFALTTSDDDPFFRPYLSDPDLLKKWVTDANVVAQEKGVEALSSLVRESGETSARLRADVYPSVVDKCFGSARASLKLKAIELGLLWIEVENSGEGLVADVLRGLEAKQPKIVQSSVTCLREIVAAFGVKTIGNPKPLLNAIPKIFGHTDKVVRSEGTLLVQQLHLFLGASLTPFLQDLKPIQISELTESFNALPPGGSGQPSRATRKQQRETQERELASAAAGDAGGAVEVADDEPLDIQPDAPPPVDILPKIPGDFFELLASTKWKDRLETLQAVHALITTAPALVDADFSAHVQAIAKRIPGDANINVVIAGANVLEGLGKGLGPAFGKYRSTVMAPMLERLKERKANVTDALGAALDASFESSSLNECTEDILTALKSKNPQVKEGALRFLNRCLKSTREAPSKDSVKPLSDALAVCTGDSAEPVRAASAESLGLMMKILGERQFAPVLEGLDDLRKGKVRECFEKAEVKFRGGAPAGRPAAAAPAPAARAPVKKPAVLKPRPAAGNIDADETDDMGPPPKPLSKGTGFGSEFPSGSNGFGSEFPDEFSAPPKPAARAPAPKPVARKPPAAAAPPTKKPPAPAASSAAKGKAPATANTSEPLKFKFSSEDAEARWQEAIPADLQAELADGNWKLRLEGAEKMTVWLGEGHASDVEAEVFFRFFAKVPGWSEKNFQVSSKIYGMMVLLADKSPTFSKACIAIAIGHLTEKLGDIKLKKPAGDALTVFAEKTSLSFVLEQAYEPLTKAKSPKTQADALVWLNQLLLDFGIAGVSMRPLIDFLKTNLKSSNAAVRANATKAMVTVKICVGTDISSFLDDLNPQLLATIEKEFAKVEGQSPPEPTRTSADLKVVAAAAGGKGGASAADALDDLIPRVDLDKLVAGTNISAGARSDNWKERKEAMETLAGILQANTRLKPGMGEVGSALKGRLADTNIMVKLLALDNISKIATGMGKPFEKHAKVLITPVCAILADQKAPTRAAATATLGAMAAACEGIDLMVPSFGISLENPNPLLRASLLAFLLEWFQEHDPATAHLTPVMKPLILCIEDRNADVRKNASTLLPLVVSSVGVDFALEQTANLKPAMRQTIVPIIQAAQLAAPRPPPASSATISATSSAAASTAVSPPRPASSASSNQSAARTNGAASPVKRSVPASAAGLPARRGVMGAIPKPAASTMSALQRPSSRATVSSMEDEAGTSRPKVAGLKRPLSMAAGPGKASSRASSVASNVVDRATPPFRTADPAHKAARAKKDASRWVFHEKAEPFHTELLANQMEAHASPELYSLLFSRDHNASVDFVNGVGLVSACFQDMAREADRFGMDEEALRQSLICNLDLILKYAAIRMYDSNTQSISRSIELVEHMIDDFSSGPTASVRHSFDEYELHLLLPTLISKLGDPKFQTRIQDLFRGKMRYVVAASKLFHVLVVQGLPLKNAKARVETLKAMTTIVKQIGTETTLTRESVSAVIRCLQDGDGKIRNGALDVLGEAYKTAGDGIYEYAKVGPKERDAMEARFKHVQGPAPLPDKTPISRVASAESTPRVGSPAASRVSRIAPPSSPAPRQPPSRGESPEKLVQASPVKASISPRPSGGSATPSRGIPRFGAPASRPLSMMQPRQSTSSSSQLPPPVLEAEPAPAPVAKPRTGQLFAPLPGRPNGQELSSGADGAHDAVQAIRSILSSDPSRSVDGLKRVQRLLETQHDRFQGSVDDLVQALVKQIRLVFDTPAHLSEPPWFRLAKHLIQTLNNFCDHAELLKEVDEKDMEELLFELTSRLLQTDDATGDAKELSRFLNMIILRIFNGGKREIIFSALFVLLKRVTISFVDEGTLATSRQAKHAELILKCIWKRARSVEDDLGDNILDPIALLRIIEDFLQTLPPTEWRRRAQTSIPLGDMPLRTVKVIIQHVVSKYGGERVYDQLSAAFDEPENTHAYAYIFRLVNQTAQVAAEQAPDTARSESPSSRAVSATSNDGRRSSATPAAQPAAGPSIAIADDVEQEMSDIVQAVVKGDSLQKRIEELSRILSQHPEKRGKFDELVAHIDPALSVFLKRALANRMPRQGSESPAVSHVAASPTTARSPTSPSQPSRLPASMTLADDQLESEVD